MSVSPTESFKFISESHNHLHQFGTALSYIDFRNPPKNFQSRKKEQFPPLGETIHSLLQGIVWNKQIQLAHRLHKLNNSPRTVSFRFVQHQAYDESCETSRGVSIPIVLTHT